MSTSTPSSVAPSVESLILQHLATINRLCLKAFDAPSKEALTFIILNDSIQAIRYDRALLWDFTQPQPKLMGVSGQTSIKKDAHLTLQWEAVVPQLNDPKQVQRLEKTSFKDEGNAWNAYQKDAQSTVLWIPIFSEDELVLGLWLEGFGQRFQEDSIQDTLKFLTQYLTPAYGAAWKKFYHKPFFQNFSVNKQQIALITFAVFAFLLLVRVPLRVVAPCEVIASDPIVVTAPLEGIIEKVQVEPGQAVKKGDLLYEYDKRLAQHSLNTSQKQVQILEEEVKRAKTLGLNDPKSLTELSILSLKLEKEKINLSYVEWQSTQLTQRATTQGIIMMENPDQWRGKPVRIGEKIMSINDPQNTKVRMWIPEDDNIVLDPETPISIVLNIDPAHTYQAHLDFVSNEATLSDLHIPSFVAEGKWVTPPEDSKLGLQGTAILYGKRVSLLYFLLRKPLAAVRHKTGL